MHDIKAIRENPDAYDRAWSSRGLEPQTQDILKWDERLRAAQTALQAAQSRRNEASKLIGQANARGDRDEAQQLIAEVQHLKDEIYDLDLEVDIAAAGLQVLLEGLPNIPAPDVPQGVDEHGNVEVRRWSQPYKFEAPKDHVDLGTALGMLDFEAAARMSGSRFVVLKGELARLERALGQFMIDLQTVEHGYLEVAPPLLVRSQSMFGTGQLPKFEIDLFKSKEPKIEGFMVSLILLLDTIELPPEVKSLALSAPIAVGAAALGREVSDQIIALRSGSLDQSMAARAKLFDIFRAQVEGTAVVLSEAAQAMLLHQSQAERNQAKLLLARKMLGEWEAAEEGLYLIPTAEVSLTNLVREQITDEAELPMRLTALTPCFRSEAGASGKDTRGMIRQHQFNKVELVSISTPEESEREHDYMVDCAEKVLKALELPFRTMLLCSGDMGFSARKTFDLEVWLPSQDTYREISSISNCGDFQARRMDARCKKAGEKGTRFVHTLNGSGLAVGRTLVAIMENYQDERGRIAIPQALHPYMRGLTHIGGA